MARSSTTAGHPTRLEHVGVQISRDIVPYVTRDQVNEIVVLLYTVAGLPLPSPPSGFAAREEGGRIRGSSGDFQRKEIEERERLGENEIPA